jgi:hypothetical protein
MVKTMLVKQYTKKINCIVGLATLLSLGSLFLDSKANALTGLLYSQTASFSNELTELDGTPALTLNQYNNMPGQMVTDVKFTFTATLSSSGTVTNTAANPQTFFVTLTPDQFDLTPDVNAPAALQAYGSFSPLSSFTQIGKLKYTSLAPNTPKDFINPITLKPYEINDTLIVTFNQATDITGFLGTGTFSFNPYTLIGTTLSGGGGNITTSIATYASASITVEYYDNSTPPPVPFDLSSNVGIGSFFGIMFGLSWWKRKRQLHQSAN